MTLTRSEWSADVGARRSYRLAMNRMRKMCLISFARLSHHSLIDRRRRRRPESIRWGGAIALFPLGWMAAGVLFWQRGGVSSPMEPIRPCESQDSLASCAGTWELNVFVLLDCVGRLKVAGGVTQHWNILLHLQTVDGQCKTSASQDRFSKKTQNYFGLFSSPNVWKCTPIVFKKLYGKMLLSHKCVLTQRIIRFWTFVTFYKVKFLPQIQKHTLEQFHIFIPIFHFLYSSIYAHFCRSYSNICKINIVRVQQNLKSASSYAWREGLGRKIHNMKEGGNCSSLSRLVVPLEHNPTPPWRMWAHLPSSSALNQLKAEGERGGKWIQINWTMEPMLPKRRQRVVFGCRPAAWCERPRSAAKLQSCFTGSWIFMSKYETVTKVRKPKDTFNNVHDQSNAWTHLVTQYLTVTTFYAVDMY